MRTWPSLFWVTVLLPVAEAVAMHSIHCAIIGVVSLLCGLVTSACGPRHRIPAALEKYAL
jgi:hypothetical protein